MGGDPAAFLERWHRIVADKDSAGLRDVLADEVSIGAPPYWTKLEGRDLVQHLLGLVIHTIDDFTYHREWLDGAELALEFTGKVDGLDLQGIDLISLDGENRLCNIDVLMRPVNAVIALRTAVAPKMQAFLSERSGS